MADITLDDVQLEIQALVSGRQTADPRLYEAILLLNRQVSDITNALDPLVRRSKEIATGVAALPAPTSFTCFSAGLTLRFTWGQVSYASQYEVRQGTNWDTSAFKFRTTGLQADIDPLKYGTYTFLIKTVDSDGLYSADFSTTTITVPQILAPAVTTSVIDNNVLIRWTEPISLFKIDYYVVAKSGGASGKVPGTFTTFFEVVSGTYSYTVQAVDVAGNVGTAATASVTVATPPDYALQDTRVSTLNGTLVNLLRLSVRPSLLGCIILNNWQQHFTTRSWLKPQDQVNAGYPIYIQPTNLTGSYTEVFDYGAVINNVIITITWNSIQYNPTQSVDIVVGLRSATTSTSGTPNWGARVNGASQYIPSLRYLELYLAWTAPSDKALLEIYNLTIAMSVKRENDGGEISALSTDVGGTQVNFNKAFKDIESITATTKSTTEPFVVIFDFQDIPNPVGFKVFVFDTMGARVSRTVDWKARGII